MQPWESNRTLGTPLELLETRTRALKGEASLSNECERQCLPNGVCQALPPCGQLRSTSLGDPLVSRCGSRNQGGWDGSAALGSAGLGCSLARTAQPKAGLLRSTVVVLRRCRTWHKMPSICCESRLRAFFVRPPTSGRGSVGILQVIALTSADTPSFVCPSEIVKWDGLPFLGRHSAP